MEEKNKKESSHAIERYKNRYVRFVRHAAAKSSSYIHGNFDAQMKKLISYFLSLSQEKSYFLDVQINDDGAILSAQCDCAAGARPDAYCKHVQAILLAICDHCAGKTMFLIETCTSKPDFSPPGQNL